MFLQNLKKRPLNSIFGKQILDIPADTELTLDAKVSSFESQKLIGVKNSSCAHDQHGTKGAIITSTPFVQISHTSNSIDEISGEVKSLSENEDNIPTKSPESFDDNDDEDKINVTFSDDDDAGYYYDLSSKNKIEINKKDESLLETKYAIEHGINPKEFSIITEAEKNRWTTGCFRGDLERDIRFYHGGIERKEDPRKYHKFLTDRERLVGEELLYRGILKSGLSTAWLDDLMEK
ncbi:15298_t:CDS:2 [Gigaspora margarita]|uniref:15298_t:CDS:1 n=1 Tax=Gigaspora margarita TaxID=4874 RepID=A0ABN7V962_GIGMA|nr:15298_t:CDS:2 [Gigaspora margarita]